MIIIVSVGRFLDTHRPIADFPEYEPRLFLFSKYSLFIYLFSVLKFHLLYMHATVSTQYRESCIHIIQCTLSPCWISSFYISLTCSLEGFFLFYFVLFECLSQCYQAMVSSTSLTAWQVALRHNWRLDWKWHAALTQSCLPASPPPRPPAMLDANGRLHTECRSPSFVPDLVDWTCLPCALV